ncbi:MAG: hypothetical protein FWE82_09935 [Defluviitaleaceae bacterium]|nr:hypothetical protein [Defluviitaleaceae bacterium]
MAEFDETFDEAPEEEAKEKAAPKKESGKKAKKKKKGFPVVPVLIILVIVGVLVAVFVFNAFNIRNQYILPFFRSIPLVGGLVPQEDPDADASVLPGMTVEQLTALVDELKMSNEKLNEDLKNANDLNNVNLQIINRLRAYEDMIEDFRTDKADFDAKIAKGDPQAFMLFFEKVSPDNAGRLYQEASLLYLYDSEYKKISNQFVEMDTSNAAEVLEILLPTNAEYVIKILQNMNTSNRAAILNEMEPSSVAIITRLMEPTPIVLS